MKVPLQRAKTLASGAIHWRKSSPFLENTRAVLIHRPRCVTTHKIGDKWGAHIAVACWCGIGFAGTHKFTFLDAPPEGKLLCARCEAAAQKAGKPSAEALVGRHVHVGGVKAFQLCCGEEGA